VTFTADYQHQDQPSTPATVLSVNTTPANIFGFIYNTCISTSEADLNAGNAPIFGPRWNTTDGLCSARANTTPELGGTGGASLGGAGFVSMTGSNPLSDAPRIFWEFASTDTGDIDKTYATGVSFAKNDVWGTSLTFDWDLSDSTTFKSISGYRQIKWSVGIDLDGTPEQIQEVTDNQNQYQFSQEFQLLGNLFDNRLEYVAGLYYFKENGFVHDFVPFQGLLYVFDYQNDVDTESYAGFMHLDFHVTDRLTATVGGRYSDETKKFIGGQADLNGFTYKISGCIDPEGEARLFLDPNIPPGVTCQQALGFPVPGQPLRYFPADELEQKFTEFTPEVGLQYQFSDDVMAYVKYSEGFKSGGWTTRLSNPISDGTFAEFKPERAESSELGLKTVFFDDRMLVNTAIFYTNYDDIQLNFQEAASPVLRNAGKAELKGAEIEAQAVLGGGFGFTVAAGYIDAKYTEINPLVIGITTASEIPKTPEYKVNFGPTLDFNLGNGGSIRVAADYTYTDQMVNDSLNTEDLKRPSTENLNAAIRYTAPNNQFELVIGGTNLTDERYLVTGSINEAAGEHVGTYSRPREWYATVRYRTQ
jgi:iron complex outermembrane receptor protein